MKYLCSFCEQPAEYSCDYIPFNGSVIIMKACEEHLSRALLRQNMEALRERIESRSIRIGYE